MQARADYGNWVSRKLIYLPGLLAMVFLALAIVSYYFLLIAVPFLIIAAYFSYAYYKFSPAGGDIQAGIRQFVLDRLQWDGRGSALDIGCGNGALTVSLARRYPAAEVTGIDYWGGKWDYSHMACVRNADIEGVGGRARFLQASAAALPYADGVFDAAVSNFVFHEVKDAADKREVVREALRVVKKGGYFSFQDLLPARRLYGDVEELLAQIRGWGIEDVRYANTSNAHFIPVILKLPFMVGSIGIIYGRK